MPYQVLSELQMSGELLNGLHSSISQPTFHGIQAVVKGIKGGDATIQLTNLYDIYLRDEVRQPGTQYGGKHGGEPLNNNEIALSNTKYSKPDLRDLIAMIDSGGAAFALPPPPPPPAPPGPPAPPPGRHGGGISHLSCRLNQILPKRCLWFPEVPITIRTRPAHQAEHCAPHILPMVLA